MVHWGRALLQSVALTMLSISQTLRITLRTEQVLATCHSPSCALIAVWPQESHSTSLNLVPHLSVEDFIVMTITRATIYQGLK